jgi:hypothetical protein
MERTDVLELMATLKLYGMRAAYDEVMQRWQPNWPTWVIAGIKRATASLARDCAIRPR